MEGIEIILDIETLEIFQIIDHGNSTADEEVHEQLTLF
ncbi:hypothetical protein STRIC_1962 [Streptococcus ictaluri 707-05]|uniref:Uncharacterized protein n=1 Tax=Streptococcus ictaluri 707-05 TaxID=764299 RepID=G5K569_9STRE|nr:hypothetical protein STRIC_1962 [Streptococcus ictaluri 707-05]